MSAHEARLERVLKRKFAVFKDSDQALSRWWNIPSELLVVSLPNETLQVQPFGGGVIVLWVSIQERAGIVESNFYAIPFNVAVAIVLDKLRRAPETGSSRKRVSNKDP
ncbi:hypothetical protein HGA91_05655 [candidate division WWE3 bacterium]|nr:hypothetical protein [candidate division WWE3 bacterium]